MSENNQYPPLLQQGKNLASFAWELVNYMHQNKDGVLFASDEIVKERLKTCAQCDKYDASQSKCVECGCYIPVKTKLILDSCPLNKWSADNTLWEEKFEKFTENLKPES
jgi:hypothetical protein